MKLSIHLKQKDSLSYYVYVSIFHNKERAIIATNYILSAKDVKNGKICNISKEAEIYNNEILKYQHLIDQIPAIDVLSAKSVKEIITCNKREDAEIVDFFAFSESYINDLRVAGRNGTATSYEWSLRAFKRFIKRDKLYTFEITSNLLQQYLKELMLQDKSAKSINVYLTHLKVLFNACRDAYNDYDLGVIVIKNYPFKKVALPSVESNAGHKALSVEDMKRLIALDVEKRNLVLAKDLFLLSFYLLGINMTDLFSLKKTSYKDGHITYSRQKTIRRAGGSKICIPVCPQAQLLIKKYQGSKEMLLNFAEEYKDVKSITSVMSHRINALYDVLKPEIDKSNFTMYSARHTWASIAANECRFTDAEVARALNHQSEHKVTRGYIRPDWSLLDRMNEAVLSVVFGE